MFSHDQNLKVRIALRETIRFFTNILASWQNILASWILWRHNHMKFWDGYRNNYMRGPSQLSTPHYSQLTLRIYAAKNGLGGGAKTDFALGAGKPSYATACNAINIECDLRLLDFGSDSSLVLANTIGIHAPSGAYHNQIDYILVQNRFRSGTTKPRPWASERRKEGKAPPVFWKFQQKKVVFWFRVGKNKFHHLWLPLEIFL